ncbi:MAG: hypothetical protein AMJ64_09070 [Betaproteobacteria bacterium SG8_39]|nr:MAG: hypothetical protein AMJ64_09070 [Betaproteobacteria bacterium SG8_39]
MKATLKNTFRLTAVAAALLAAYGTAFAQAQTLAQENPEIGRLASPSTDDNLSLGYGGWDNDRPFQGQYDGMSRKRDGYLLFDGQVRRRDDATGGWFTLDMRNMGLETRELRLGVERQGDMGGYIDFNQIPRDYPWTINTNLLGHTTTNQTVQAAPPDYELHLGTRRDRVGLGFFKNLDGLLPGLKFKVDFRNEDKTGLQNYSMGSRPVFLTQPLDSTIQLLDAHLEYSKDKLQMRGGFYTTSYSTNVKQILGVDNGGGTTPLSQPLDNQSWEVYLDGGYSFTPTTRATFKAKYGEATMDEHLPSWDLTGGNAPNPNMSSSIDGKINTTLLQAGITSRPIPKLSLVANLRYYDVKDKTPLYLVVGPPGGGNGPVHNTPQSVETTSGKIEGTYRLPMGFSVIGSIDGKDQNRSQPQFIDEIYVPYRTSLKEWNYGIQLRRGLSETINGSLGYIYSKRDGGEYSPTNHAPRFAENMIRPWNIADRTRDRWRLKLDWTPVESFTLTGVFEDATDKYPTDGRPYGMQKGEGNFYSLDGTFQINPDWQLVGFYAYDRTKAHRYHGRWQGGFGGGTEEFEGNKDAHLTDKGDTVGFSLNGKVNSKWKIGADVLYTKANSSYNESWYPSGGGGDQNQFPGAPDLASLPNIETELTRLRLYADYALHKKGSLRFDVMYEDWRTNDWTYSYDSGSPFVFGTTGGANGDGTYFSQKSPQKATFVGLRYKYLLD